MNSFFSYFITVILKISKAAQSDRFYSLQLRFSLTFWKISFSNVYSRLFIYIYKYELLTSTSMFNVRKTQEYINLRLKRKETVARRCSVKKVFLEISQNSQENTCASACSFIKNTFSYRTPLMAASEHSKWTLVLNHI